ncbi:MAG TPA: aldehyde dehydrogenase family protein, partial [Flavobacteriales bacterium]|nr:aldehyde dehydrogenase family protein [Flavobacteriales bacterium]
NGKWQKPKSGKYFDTINPANEQKLARIAQAGEADVDAAVKAARKAYDTVWSRMPAPERGKYIYRIARLLQKNARGFAIIESTGADKDDLEWCHMDLPFATATLPARCALPSWDDNTHCISRHGIETH